MTHRPPRTRGMISRPARAGAVAVVTLALTMLLAIPAVSAYTGTDGPQLLIDQVAVTPGIPVTVVLNRFPAGQSVIVHLYQSQPGDQTLPPLTFPVTTDSVGSGAIVVATAGFPPGNYTLNASLEGASGDVEGALSAFAIVDPGFAGPRIVRTDSQAGDGDE